MAELRLPTYTVPFRGWIAIGILYYVICFAILYRLFRLASTPPRNAAFGLLGVLMFFNALWNYFFFRRRNLFHAYLLALPYSAIAIVLFGLLLSRVDRAAAWWLLPYLLYLLYANVWVYRTWKFK